MGGVRRSRAIIDADRRAAEVAATLGERIRAARRRRGWTQAFLGDKVGIGASRICQLEGGDGANASLRAWFELAGVLGLSLRLDVGRDPLAEPVDAGHLLIQDLLLRLGRSVGYVRSFEMPTRPADPSRSADVCLRDDRGRCLLLVEAWNTIGDIGAAARATNRKIADAEALAVVYGGDAGPYKVRSCWVVRATRANRALVARYPEVFAARFPASSTHWVRALTSGAAPPELPGLVWCDVAATRLFAWRLNRARVAGEPVPASRCPRATTGPRRPRPPLDR